MFVWLATPSKYKVTFSTYKSSVTVAICSTDELVKFSVSGGEVKVTLGAVPLVQP